MNVTIERMCLRICGVAVLAAAVVAALHGCKRQDESSAVPWKSGVTVIGGNLGWDAESDRVLDPRAATADLWWELMSETRSSLTPVNGTAVAIVRNANYDRIGPNFIRRARMAPQRLETDNKDNVLAPGTVIVFRTSDGVLGKLQIVAYRPLHDLSFPGTAAYFDQWKLEALRRPNYERYHLEVKWSLFLPEDQ
jgi:hypothetical protein